MPAATFFNHSNDATVVPGMYQGMTDWFKVPPAWFLVTIDGQLWAYEVSTLTGRRWACKINDIGEAVFQDTLRSNS